MTPNPELEMLLALEKRYAAKERGYAAALSGVRQAIAIERDGLVLADAATTPTPITPMNGFAALTKGDAVEQLMKESGDLHTSEMFRQMKLRGHSVANERALGAMLSHDPRFTPKGKGVWMLAQPALPSEGISNLNQSP